MARYKGHQGAVSVGASAVGEIESFDLEISVNELDANTMGNDWTNVEGGQKTATGTIAVLTDPADAGQSALTVGSAVTLTLYPEGNTTGLEEISGSFMVLSKNKSSAVGDLVKTSYSVRNKGTITEGTVS
jgi:hypothetical protein